MAKLISKCCVCGRIMAVTTCEVKGLGKYDERITHGYCGSSCKQHTPVQVLFWDEKLSIFNADVGHRVEGINYFRGQLMDRYISFEQGNVYGVNCDGEKYAEEIIFRSPDIRQAMVVAKEEARKWGVNIILN